MNRPISLATLPALNLMSRSPSRHRFVLLTLAGFALVQPTPAQDGGYSRNNTAEGSGALNQIVNAGASGVNNTAVGANALNQNTAGNGNTAAGAFSLEQNTSGVVNTAVGFEALNQNTTGNDNTASGSGTLLSNTTGNDNTAIGNIALISNTIGSNNTATGSGALQKNTTGNFNTATGVTALFSNTTGTNNIASGASALYSNTSGGNNIASGIDALYSNMTGYDNVADGDFALYHNTVGHDNTGSGNQTLFNNTTGSFNMALGPFAGYNLTTGSNNIDIGNNGVAGESKKIRIGKQGTQAATFIAGIYNVNEGGTIKPLYINSNGQLGTQAPASSRRFKKEIKPMDQTSESILGLKPVTFQYKSDSERTPQFGLIAEEVAKVNPDLIVRDEDGEIYTVRYDAVNAMLLNEFLKEHRMVQELKSIVAKQEATAAQQQTEIKALKAGLKEQAAQIQKVNAQIEVTKPAPQVLVNNS